MATAKVSQKKLREDWLKALESGKYQQGQHALCAKPTMVTSIVVWA
jgi:hypothetical protein